MGFRRKLHVAALWLAVALLALSLSAAGASSVTVVLENDTFVHPTKAGFSYYREIDDPEGGTLKFMIYDSGNYTEYTPDTTLNDVGQFTSFVWKDSDTGWISHYDWEDDDLRYVEVDDS